MSQSARTALSAISFALGLALGLVLALVLVRSDVRAQRSESAPVGAAVPVAIAPGPGGMWIVYGNRLRVCVAGALPAGVQPFTPECGEPLALY